MNNFELYLNQYGLHDTTVDQVVLNRFAIVFRFESGVYSLDSNGKLANKTDACNMNIYIKDFDKEKMYEHVEVKKIYKTKIVDVAFDKFLELLNNDSFKIYLDYYSFFANSILLSGSLGKFEFEIRITDIEKIVFDFQKI